MEVESIVFSIMLKLVMVCILYFFLYAFFKIILSIFFTPISSKWLAHGYLLSYLLGSTASMSITMYFIPDFDIRQHVVSLMILGMLATINLIIVPFLYWYDKRCSQIESASRIPENVLHAFAFTGGAASALVSQQVFRHKTKKTIFRVLTPIALVTSGLIFYALIKYSSLFAV